jgi:hypothetical protein
MADKFPDLTGGWRSRPEVWAPALVGHWMGLEPLPQAQVAEATAVLSQNPPNLGRLERGVSSWNWDWMIGAAALWRPDGDKTDVLLFWTALLRAQAGIGAKRDTLLGKFEGSEPTSSTYTSWRAGSTLAVLHWCRTHTGSVLAQRVRTVERAAVRWLDIWCGVQALGVVPWPDRVGYRAASGSLWWKGPTPSPVGERSTRAYHPDQTALWALLVDWPPEQLRFSRTGWPTLVAQRVGHRATTARDLRTWAQKRTGLSKVLTGLARVRLFGAQHWIRFPQGLLVYREHRLNNNSPTHLYSWAPDAAQTMALGYPVPPGGRGRGPRAPQGGEAVLHDPPPRRFIEARIGDERRETDLPESRILSHVIGDERGFRNTVDVIVMPEEGEEAAGP